MNIRRQACTLLIICRTIMSTGQHYRKDGVRITHNPYAPGMAEKYGTPGATDQEGFDPYADTVGPGIYGGIQAGRGRADSCGTAVSRPQPTPWTNLCGRGVRAGEPGSRRQ